VRPAARRCADGRADAAADILLDHMGVIKYVDFGAAKVLAKNHRTMMRSRRPASSPDAAGGGTPNGLSGGPVAGAPGALGGGLGVNNSLTGTPMYMSPEVIKNDKRGRRGAMDVWALGCVVLEFATGRKPWSNLDNEWAIMFHIGVAREHPPLPEPHQLSEMGIDFVRACMLPRDTLG
jgi:mitogen-activated protein kinase kinase kinase